MFLYKYYSFFIYGFLIGELINFNLTFASHHQKPRLHDLMNSDEISLYFGELINNSPPDYELINLPKNLQIYENDAIDYDIISELEVNDNNGEIPLNINAFDQPITLKLKRNLNLIKPITKIIKRTSDGDVLIDSVDETVENCHYLHSDKDTVAALSNCLNDQITGLIIMPNMTLEIQPLTERLRNILSPEALSDEGRLTYDINSTNDNVLHLVKRVLPPPQIHDDPDLGRRNLIKERAIKGTGQMYPELLNLFNNGDPFNNFGRDKRATREFTITIEVAVFFDEAAYKIFAPYFNYDDKKIRDMILAYMNGVQALYQHPSLGTPVSIAIVYMEIMERQPPKMPTYRGERGQLLDSFCDYQMRLNPGTDSDSGHWDMAVYISGLDFFAYENGRYSAVTMGLATVGGVCSAQYDCVISEFGVTNDYGKPYPSAGFTSVYIMAHEMGHNLGMHHDSSGNRCPAEGHVMSPSRGTNGETTWSTCSADVIRSLSWAKCLFDKELMMPVENNAWKYEGFPGRTWTAKKQCEILLTDKDAVPVPSQTGEQICQSLQCRTPHRSGYYYAGPALDGTDCANNQWCETGFCVPKRALPKPLKVVKGGWSKWREGKCRSGCINESIGYKYKNRTCDNPVPINTDEGCEGLSFELLLCDDSKFCKHKRRTVETFASKRCKLYAEKLPDLDKNGVGLQSPHEPERLWMGCSIFCRREDTGMFYTPRIELNDLGLNPYFPDGTRCHSESGENYYCQNHKCLPEKSMKNQKGKIFSYDMDIPMAGNAPAHMKPFNQKLLDYMSIDRNGKPLLTRLEPNDWPTDNEDDWNDNDYIELPTKEQIIDNSLY